MDFLNQTCAKCIYKKLFPQPKSKELLTACVRFPPKQLVFMTNNGPAFVTAFPDVSNDTLACGEWDDGEDIAVGDYPVMKEH